MNRTLHEKICDQCGKKSVCEDGVFGNHAHSGWITLSQIVAPTMRHDTMYAGDFCSAQCLKDYIAMMEEA